MWKPFAIALPAALAALELLYYLLHLTNFGAYPIAEWYCHIAAILVGVILAVWWQPCIYSRRVNIISAIVCASTLLFSIQIIELHTSPDGLSNSFSVYGGIVIKTRSDPHAYAANSKYYRGRAFYGFGRLVFVRSDGHRETRLMFHVWPVILFSAIPLASWIRHYIHTRIRASRAARNRCINCGYNLIATPDRCPECGALQPNKN
jgi:hypothetical protein